MILREYIGLQAGGPGSGRHKGGGSPTAPQFMYHVTDVKNLASIKKNGLVPKDPRGVDAPKGIYLTNLAYDEDYPPYEGGVVLKVRIPKDAELVKDPTHDSSRKSVWMVSKKKIAPEHITVHEISKFK